MTRAFPAGADRVLYILLAVMALGACTSPGAADGAADRPERAFRFHHEAAARNLPESFAGGYLWLPLPPDTEDRTIHDLTMQSERPYERVRDPRHGNEAVRFDHRPGLPGAQAVLEFTVVRRARVRRPGNFPQSTNRPPREELAPWLAADRLVPIDGRVREQANETVAGKHTNLEKARALHDYAVALQARRE